MPPALRPRSATPRAPCPCSRQLLTYISTVDTQTLKGRSGSDSVGSLGPGAHKVLFEPSEHLQLVWGLILNRILALLLSCWASPLPLDVGYFFIFLVGSNISQLMDVQQQVVILEFSKEKMSASPSNPPFCVVL